MKQIIFIILGFLFFQLSAQNLVEQSRYWFNSDYSEAVTADLVTPAATIVFSENISVEHLSGGLHTFHIQFRDSENHWSSTRSSFFYKTEPGPTGSNLVEAYELWFNDNFEDALVVEVENAAVISLNESFDAAGMTSGLHTFHIRFRDSQGLWSSSHSAFFYKLPEEHVAEAEVSQLQYWVNNDFDQAVLVDAGNQQSFTLDDNLDFSELHNGIHTLHIRFRDSAGKWSSTLSSFFYKVGAEEVAGTQIVEYQYWVNNDFQGAVTANASNEQTFLLSEYLDFSQISDGLHTLHIRFRDESSRWSSVHSSYFYKVPVSEVADNKITTYRYWLNDAWQQAAHVELEEAVNPFEWITLLEMRQVPAGVYTVHFQFKDEYGLWSSVLSEEFEKLLLPWADFTVNENEFCHEGTVYFTNNSVDADTWHWDFGDGQESEAFEPEHFYGDHGSYTVTLTASDFETGLDHVTTAMIDIYPAYEFTEEHQICEGDTFTWQGNEYDTAGNYTAVYETIHGCDSVYVLNLAVSPAYAFEENEAICEGEVYEWHGDAYTEQGTYHALYQTGLGCDSIYTLHLTVNPVYEIAEHHEICAGEVFEWFGEECSEAGYYHHTEETQAGCDSLFVLDLTVFYVDTAVTLVENTLIAHAQDALFQWVDCSDGQEITGETGAEFTPGESGEYAVWVTQGECTALSQCVEVMVTSLADYDFSSGIRVYPNPADRFVNIILEEEGKVFSVSLYDLKGQRMYHQEGQKGELYQLELAGMVPGIYLLEVRHNGQVSRFKLVRE